MRPLAIGNSVWPSPTRVQPAAAKTFLEDKAMRKQPAFFSAHALRDGTIWLAVPMCKPRDDRDVDAEGVCRWFVDKVGENPGLNDLGNVTRNICITTCVNVRRALREKVENRLDALQQAVTAVKSQLDRIEAKLTELIPNSRNSP